MITFARSFRFDQIFVLYGNRLSLLLGLIHVNLIFQIWTSEYASNPNLAFRSIYYLNSLIISRGVKFDGLLSRGIICNIFYALVLCFFYGFDIILNLVFKLLFTFHSGRIEIILSYFILNPSWGLVFKGLIHSLDGILFFISVFSVERSFKHNLEYVFLCFLIVIYVLLLA